MIIFHHMVNKMPQ